MKKKILIVDDSALMRRVMCDIINTDSNFEAADICRDGLEAYEVLKQKQYDGVLLDINMPRMDGLQLLEKLQEDNIKATVIMVSTLTTEGAEETMIAMERGAVDFVTKPSNIIEAKGEFFKEKVLNVLSAIIDSKQYQKKAQSAPLPKPGKKKKGAFHDKLIALACSTGGPKALQSVIPFLDPNMDAPLVLVQHMPAGFTKSMADRLDAISPLPVKEAEDGDILEKGHVYIAPGGRHLEVEQQKDGRRKIILNDAPAIGGLRPCANVMYESLLDCTFDEITCVILTGMGADGTSGVKELKKNGPIHVIAQSADTCVVYGMPRAVAEAGLVDEVVPLDQVAQSILKNVGVK